MQKEIPGVMKQIEPEYRSVYLAGPFFNSIQIDIIKRIEDLCDAMGILCNSPRKFLVLKPKACWEERGLVFRDNLLKIQSSGITLACLDNPDSKGNPRPPDPGTIWEMGYAYAIGRPVVAFSTDELLRINVMLAQGCRGFLRGLPEVGEFLEGHEDLNDKNSSWDYNWGIAQEWRKEIQ